MRRETKQARIDADSGFVLLTPEESKELRRGLSEAESAQRSAQIYSAVKHRLEEAVRENGFDETVCDKAEARDANWRRLGASLMEAAGPDFAGNVKFTDHGIDKFVMVCVDGVAVKAGRMAELMATEIRTSRKRPELTCFPKLLDWSDGMSTALVEAVERTFDDAACRAMFGLDLVNMYLEICGDEDQIYTWGKALPRFGTERTRFRRALDSGKGPEWDSLRDLRTFCRTNLNGILLDVGFHNWGLARRNGVLVPVVYDYDY